MSRQPQRAVGRETGCPASWGLPVQEILGRSFHCRVTRQEPQAWLFFSTSLNPTLIPL